MWLYMLHTEKANKLIVMKLVVYISMVKFPSRYNLKLGKAGTMKSLKTAKILILLQ